MPFFVPHDTRSTAEQGRNTAPGALQSVFACRLSSVGRGSHSRLSRKASFSGAVSGCPTSPDRIHRSRESLDAADFSEPALRPCSPGRLNCRGWAASSRLQRLTSGRRTARCPRLQSQAREDLPDHRLLKPAAMIFSSPPQFGQCSRSISNTRLSSFAQLSRTGRWCAKSARGAGAHRLAQRPAATRRVVSQPAAVAPGMRRRTAVGHCFLTQLVLVASTGRNHWREQLEIL